MHPKIDVGGFNKRSDWHEKWLHRKQPLYNCKSIRKSICQKKKTETIVVGKVRNCVCEFRTIRMQANSLTWRDARCWWCWWCWSSRRRFCLFSFGRRIELRTHLGCDESRRILNGTPTSASKENENGWQGQRVYVLYTFTYTDTEQCWLPSKIYFKIQWVSIVEKQTCSCAINYGTACFDVVVFSTPLRNSTHECIFDEPDTAARHSIVVETLRYFVSVTHVARNVQLLLWTISPGVI